MFFLGILAILQMTLLPGLVLKKAFRLKLGSIQGLVYCFGLSLIANYAAVLLLTTLGLYRQVVVLTLVIAEVAAGLWLYRAELLQSWKVTGVSLWNRLSSLLHYLLPDLKSVEEDRSIYDVLVGVVTAVFAFFAITDLFWAVMVFISNIGSVFNSWDAVLSWNRWATEWAQNQFPSGVGLYPQLLPANWSLTYIMMNDIHVQFFAKATIPLFLFFILLIFFDLGLNWKSMGAFIGLILTRLIIKKFTGEFIAEGYADIPMACMAFLSVYALIKVKGQSDPLVQRQGIFLGAVFAGGAAVTKAAGIYLLVLYPLLAYLLVLRSRREWTRREKTHTLLMGLGIALLLCVPWYTYKQIQIAQGLDANNVEYVTSGIYHGASMLERLSHAFQSLDKYIILLALMIPALFLLDSAYRWLVILLVIPFSLIWAGYFSYDTRNLALIFPFWGLAAGLCLERLFKIGFALAVRLKMERLKAYVGVVLLLLVLIGLGFAYPASALKEKQTTQQKQIFNASLNAQLYDYIGQVGKNIKILTSYPVEFLPGLENIEVNYSFNDYASFNQQISQPEINYLLIPVNVNDEIKQAVTQNLDNGNYRLIFEDDHFIPYQFIYLKKKP
jgi:uncharacterized membrane protein